MKFSDKLSKMRKNNNLSQEQFADKMGVSRQAVSKWESGASYPDMDKIINMCKILNCNLDDLLDDGIIETKEHNNKININSYINDFLNFITKSYNMFWSMTFKQKMKCLFELFTIFVILFLLGMILYSIFNYVITDLIIKIPYIGYIFSNIIKSFIIIIILMIGITIFLHLFKIRYLDYFITIEDEFTKEKKKENEIDEGKIIKNIEIDKNQKIIIRDPKHSKYNFFNIFGKIITYILKFFSAIFIVPIIFITILLIIIFSIAIYNCYYGSLFLFISLALLGAILICFIILYFIYNFIFNKEIKFKLMFIIFVFGLIFIGVGSGISMMKMMEYEYVPSKNIDVSKKLETKEEIVKMNNNIVIENHTLGNINYIIDNSVQDIKFKYTYVKGMQILFSECVDEYIVYHVHYNGMYPYDAYKMLKDDLKKKRIVDYSDSIKIDVILSEENYKIIKENSENY